MGNYNAGLWHTCVPKNMWHPVTVSSRCSDSSLIDDDVCEFHENSNVTYLEQVIIGDNDNELHKLLDTRIDLNVSLNKKKDTALILAVRLGHINQVKMLLNQHSCDKNKLNMKNCSAMDVALITAYDNYLEQHNTCYWEIIQTLMEADCEPICRDAMLYVIRTALKFEHTDFIYTLINTAIRHSISCQFHELLLLKLHRLQPVFAGNMDYIFKKLSEFTVKLLCEYSEEELSPIVNSMAYYLESKWNSNQTKLELFKKLVTYVVAAGWVWSPQHVTHIYHISPHLGDWCCKSRKNVSSLQHLCRKTYRKSLRCTVSQAVNLQSNRIPEPIQEYLLLKDVAVLLKYEDIFF